MEDLTRVRFTNLDKLMYPGLRLSKKDVIEYYIRVAPRILPFLRDRALVRNRYPDGVQAEGVLREGRPARGPRLGQDPREAQQVGGQGHQFWGFPSSSRCLMNYLCLAPLVCS